MSIPIIDLDEVAQGWLPIRVVFERTTKNLGVNAAALFLEIVPQRGEELWDLYRKSDAISFEDFVRETISREPLKFFYPKECEWDGAVKSILIQEIAAKVGSLVTTYTDLLNIYYAEGEIYNTARNFTCRGCAMTNCIHWMKSSYESATHVRETPIDERFRPFPFTDKTLQKK